jgi:predicted dehydrogenase
VTNVTSTLMAKGAPLALGANAVEDYAVATLTLDTGAVVRLACSWRLHAGEPAVIGAAFQGVEGGAALRNVGGSFYDFAADRLDGTTRRNLATPPDAWGGRAAADWASRLAAGARFDPHAERLVDVARVLDRIYEVTRLLNLVTLIAQHMGLHVEDEEELSLLAREVAPETILDTIAAAEQKAPGGD